MDVQEIIQIIGSIVATIFLPLLGGLQFYNARKRKIKAEASKSEADSVSLYAKEWKELYEKKEKRVGELDAKIDSLYAYIEEQRTYTRSLTRENSDLKIKISSLEFRKCNKHGCPDREPPSEF